MQWHSHLSRVSPFLGGFFIPPMDALDSGMLTRRDKDHENHLDRQSQKRSASFS